RNDDLFVAAFKNYPAIFNSLDRNLVNLSADLEAELLTFRHGLAIDDRETRGAIERDGGDEKCARWNFTLVGSAGRNFSGWFPANRPKWTPRSGINVEGRFVLERDGRWFFCWLILEFDRRGFVFRFILQRDRRRVFVGGQQSRRCKYRPTDDGEKFVHRFSITVVAAITTC